MLEEKVASAEGVLKVDEVAWRATRSRFFFLPVTVYAIIEYTVVVVVLTG